MRTRRGGLLAAVFLWGAVGGSVATAQVPQSPAAVPPGSPAPVYASPRPTGVDRLTRLTVPADPAEPSPPEPGLPEGQLAGPTPRTTARATAAGRRSGRRSRSASTG